VERREDGMAVITGVSGSGKTSLAFETLFAEGQRRFVESLSTYARRFFSRLDRAPVDRISGLRPAIAIDQKAGVKNPRSTVATTTEIHDHLRLLFARAGTPHCPECGHGIAATSPSAAAAELLAKAAERKVWLLAPLFVRGGRRPLLLQKPSDLATASADLRAEGFVRILVDGEERRLDVPDALSGIDDERTRAIDLVLDRVRVESG